MTRRKLLYITRHPLVAWRFRRACRAVWSPTQIPGTYRTGRGGA